jgi:NlpC/P60 family putative phage cell wall peptidase
MTTREAVVAEALTWLGTPYHHHARIKGAGVDCAQILCAVFEAAGMVTPVDTGFYPTDWHLHNSEERYMGWLDRYARRLALDEEARPGDVALFKFGRCYSHGGILIEPGMLAHAYIGMGVIRSRFTEAPLAGRPVKYWSLFA